MALLCKVEYYLDFGVKYDAGLFCLMQSMKGNQAIFDRELESIV